MKPNTKVRLAFGYYQGRTDVGLRVTDDNSGKILLDCDLSAKDFRALLSSQMIDVEAWVNTNLDGRLTRKVRVESLQVPREVASHGKDDETKAQAWVDAQAADQKADEWECRRTNQGWSGILRWYDDEALVAQ